MSFTDERVRAAFEAEADLEPPVHVVVVMGESGTERWRHDELDLLGLLLGARLDGSLIRSVRFVRPDPVERRGGELDARLTDPFVNPRLAAARRHAELVVRVITSTEEERWTSPASLVSLSVLGMWLVPAEYLAAETELEAYVVDVRSGALMVEVAGRGRAEDVVPLGRLEPGMRRLRAGARVRALEDLLPDLACGIELALGERSCLLGPPVEPLPEPDPGGGRRPWRPDRDRR